MKKLFITGALLLSTVAFTTVQAKESKVAEGALKRADYCRYRSILVAIYIDNNEYGTEDFQIDYLSLYRDCMGN